MAKREMKTNNDEQIVDAQDQTVDVTPKEKAQPTPVYVITGCSKLRVRRKPDANAEVVCLVDETNELTVKEVEGAKDWVRVTTDSGKKGFCMKKFVTIK